MVGRRYTMNRFQPNKSGFSSLGNDLQPTLEIMETIRGKIENSRIEIPGVVVVGAQSSGKSSLLENLSGVPLPTGNNITTRVPLVIRLEYQPDANKPIVVISDNSYMDNGETIEDITHVSNKIEEYTTRLAGHNGRVVDKPIHLKIIQNNTPSVTLIDLPGITHMSVDNVQEDIHEQTLALVRKYVTNERMIILCVVPAGDDFSNSEAIKIAKTVDETGRRTLGVITKIDICHENIIEKILATGRNVSLDLGFIAIRNKGKEDKRKPNIKDTLRLESEFFNNSSHYKDLNKNYWGLDTLINRIITLQKKSIDDALPLIKSELKKEIIRMEEEVRLFAKPLDTKQEQIHFILNVLLSILESCNEQQSLETSIYRFFKMFNDNLKKNEPNYLDMEYHKKISTLVDETEGILLSNFLSPVIFKKVFEDLTSHVESCSKDVVESCFVYVKDGLKSYVANNRIIQNNTKIMDLLNKIIDEFYTENYTKLKASVELLLDCEKNVFTQHNDYISTIKKIRNAVEDDIPNIKGLTNEFLSNYQQCNENTNVHTTYEVQISLCAYSKIVINRISDMVPMMIFKYFISSINSSLITSTMVYLSDLNLQEYFVDDKEHQKYQSDCVKRLTELKECNVRLQNMS